ncbi:MAG: ATP-binding protein [Chloroflexus sp.]
MNVATTDWITANQRYLTVAIDLLRRRLSASHDGQQPVTEAEQALALVRATMPALPAIERLRLIFALSDFEYETLLLCAGVECDSRLSALCAAGHGDPQRHRPSIGLVLATLPTAHWSAFTPTAPLRYWRLIELTEDGPLVNVPLRIDERVLYYLLGIVTLDQRLQPIARLLEPSSALPESHRRLAERIAALWEQERDPALVQICGADPASRHAIAAAVGQQSERSVYIIRAEDLPTTANEQAVLARIWEREAAFSGALLLITVTDAEQLRGLAGFLERVQGPIMLAATDPVCTGDRLMVRFDTPTPDRVEQRALWHQVLGERAALLNGQIDPLLAQFTLNASAIRAASLVAQSDHLSAWWQACRLQTRSRLDGLARRIESIASWEDLVLPAEHMATLHQIAAHVRQRTRVYEQWGFGLRNERGLGISALFAGPSGTGKTLAAEVLAHELQLDLYHIDLSAVVSKYIGETEKNLRQIFDAAESGGAILLFDEADALFGRRSEVKDSHDRYANLEVSYLLQRMEAYRGLAILTTNMKQAIDNAFLRRIRFIVHFPFPDATQRRRIWQRIFPSQTPSVGLDWNRLAQLNLAGGNIRSVALNAAFLAADADEPVQMKHVLSAVQSEYAKLDKPLTETELRGW